ncbi:hypothetical protein D3C79_563940 [compost metagenome]
MLRQRHCPWEITAPDPGRQAVHRVIGLFDQLPFVVERQRHQHRAKDLFLASAGAVAQPFDNRRQVIAAARQQRIGRCLAANHDPPALLLRQRHIVRHALAMFVVNQRTKMHPRRQRVAHPQSRRQFTQTRQQRLVQRTLYKQPRTGDARLAGRAENAVADPTRRLFQIGVFQHDGRRLAAQFQRGGDQFFSGNMRQMATGTGAAGKGNLFHQRMTRQRFANHRAFARQHAEQPGRQPRLFEQLRQF